MFRESWLPIWCFKWLNSLHACKTNGQVCYFKLSVVHVMIDIATSTPNKWKWIEKTVMQSTCFIKFTFEGDLLETLANISQNWAETAIGSCARTSKWSRINKKLSNVEEYWSLLNSWPLFQASRQNYRH